MTKSQSNIPGPVRRSTRGNAAAAPAQATTTAQEKQKPVKRSTRTIKSKQDVMSSGEEDEIDQDEAEDEHEDTTTQTRTRTRAVRSSTTGQRNGATTSRGNPATKHGSTIATTTTATTNAAKATRGKGKGKVVESDDEEASSSEEDNVDADSDFEAPVGGQRTKADGAKAKRGAGKVQSKPLAGRSKKGGVSKAFKMTKTGPNGGEEADEDEPQSELFNATFGPDMPLDAVLTAWVNQFKQNSDEAMLGLTNFLIKSCGCTQFVTMEEFVKKNNNLDDDGSTKSSEEEEEEEEVDAVEVLQGVLERYKETTHNFDYPIVSKAKEFKKFKKALLEFYHRLLLKIQADILFDKKFLKTLLLWTVSLSGTAFRPFRHTAAVVAMGIATSLAGIAAEIQGDLNVTNRQLATSQKQRAMQAKVRQLEKKATNDQDRKDIVDKAMDKIFHSVFVFRCRDVDPLVRVDCIRELGQWMVAYPDRFVATVYLHYLIKMLSDRTAAVRLESLKVLTKLYETENQPNSLSTFTERHADQYVEMAIGESDLSARVGAIRVATLVHKHGQLDEAMQVQLSTLIFGTDAKVRKTLAKFVKAYVWEEQVEKRMATCELLVASGKDSGAATEVRKDWIELKSLIHFLIRVGKTEDEQNRESVGVANGASRLIDETKVGRVALAVEALWSEVESLKNWKSIAEYLLEDHSAASTTSTRNNKPSTLEECYTLDEEEENMLVEIFVASLQLTLAPPAVPGFVKDKAKVKAQQDEVVNEVGRFVVTILPQLFVKYNVDAVRIRSVLVIPQLIPLNIYLDLRMVNAYEELVDEVIKTFKKHSDASVLYTAAQTLRRMQGYEILRTSHETKIETLGMSLVDAFMILMAQQETLDPSDQVVLEELTIGLRRLEYLVKCTDVTTRRMGTNERDPFDALMQVIEGFKSVKEEDSEVVISAMSTAFLWISWVCRGIASKHGENSDWTEDESHDLLKKQESLVRQISDIALGQLPNVEAKIRRKAFQVLGDIYWLFGGDLFHTSRGVNRRRLRLECSETTQAECEKFVRSEFEVWSSMIQEKMTSLSEARASKNPVEKRGGRSTGKSRRKQSDEEDEEAEAVNMEELLEDERNAATLVEQDEKYEMFGTVFSFMRQIILKDFDMRRAVIVLAQFGRFGAEFDEGLKRVVTSIKAQTTEGPSREARAQKAEEFMKVCLDSLERAFGAYVEGKVHSTDQSLRLARVLMTAIRPPGFMQMRTGGIDVRLVWGLQKQGVLHTIQKTSLFETDGDHKQKAKMIQFFDLLGQLLHGIQPMINEISAIQQLIEKECQDRDLTITEDDYWGPLRSYQSRLEKLVQKATAEQATAAKRASDAAAAAAAAAAERAQAQVQTRHEQDTLDVEMAMGEEARLSMLNLDRDLMGPIAVETEVVTTTTTTTVVVGKKRRVIAEDDGDEEEEEEERETTEDAGEGSGGRENGRRDVNGGEREDGREESLHRAGNETKRIRTE